MIIQPDPIFTELFARQERDRTLRKAEEYELRRALRDAREAARAQRRADRQSRTFRRLRPRTGHRRPIAGRLRAVIRHA